MKAITLRQPGDADVLKLEEIPEPTIRPDQVLVRIRAVALNHLDIWVRRGMPHLKLSYPHILGSDIAGEVAEIGALAQGIFAPGQKVLVHPGISCGRCEKCALGQDNLCPGYKIFGEHINGGYAQAIAVPVQNLLPYPENLSFAQAACLPLVFLTAWQMLVDKARIRPGMTVLIHGGTSGVGSAGIQIAKLFGCRVVTTAGSDEKLAKCEAWGADGLINYNEENLGEALVQFAGKQGIDVVFDHIGQNFWKENLLCLKWGGAIVTCGATTGYQAETDLRQIFFRQLRILGSTMGSRGSQFEILRLVERGLLKPILDRVLPLEDAAEAHHLLESGKIIGKIVLISG